MQVFIIYTILHIYILRKKMKYTFNLGTIVEIGHIDIYYLTVTYVVRENVGY